MNAPIRHRFNVFADLLAEPFPIGEHLGTYYDRIEKDTDNPKKEAIYNATNRILAQAGITSEGLMLTVTRQKGTAAALDIHFEIPASFQPPNPTEEHHFHFAPMPIKAAASLLRTINYPEVDPEIFTNLYIASLIPISVAPEEQDKIAMIRIPNLYHDVGYPNIMEQMIGAIDAEAGWSGAGEPTPLH